MSLLRIVIATTLLLFVVVFAAVTDLPWKALLTAGLIGIITGCAALFGSLYPKPKTVLLIALALGSAGVGVFLFYFFTFNGISNFYLTLGTGYVIGICAFLSVQYVRAAVTSG